MPNRSLQSVDFIRPDGKYVSGLVPVHKNNSTQALSIDERFVVLNAKSFERIDFVYFRRFSDERSSQVAAYVVDNCDEKLDEDTLSELHLQVWLQGTSPLLYVAWPSRIDVLTCARGPDFWNKRYEQPEYKPAKRFELDALKTVGEISEEMRRFSAFRLGDGTFWEDPHSAKLAKHDKAAHQSLIQAVVEADRKINGQNNPVMRRLLLLMVLVKYLEDREVFPNEGWFGRFHKGARNFFEVLRGGIPDEVERLLESLRDKFNGDVFDLSRLPMQKLTKKSLKTFADLVEAQTLKHQRYLWKQFSFKHLPVEIISHLYQRFVEDGHGAVYTPAFLAGLLLDHAMPYDKLRGNERVLDPACGSGIFLVGAFRRLVNVWRNRHDWKLPKVAKLKEILAQSIYGVDLDSNAVDLAAFSLSLAICDALKPEVIWKELTFDPLLDSNLFENDFFHLLVDRNKGAPTLLDEHFDIVIGNPPFESALTEAGNEIDELAQQRNSIRGKCPDKQVAYLFFEQALTILRPKSGRVCLIQPSQLLYTRSPRTFYVNLCRQYRIDSVLDFTSIRNLYEADPKTLAILAFASKPGKNHFINHWTFRRTASVLSRICFELDHYDHHRISQEESEEDPFVWRSNLLGGGRLIGMSRRLRNMRTLVEYLQKNIEEKKWDYGEGFIAATTGRREPATFLTHRPYLPTDAFTASRIDENRIGTVKETLFRSAYSEERYTAPLVLIKENDRLPVAFRNSGFLAYRNEIVGIHAPLSEATELRKLYNFLCQRHDLLRFMVTIHGSRSFISKSTAILKSDIDQLPFPEEDRLLNLSFWEQAILSDVLKYMGEYVRLGQNSDLLRTQAETKVLSLYSDLFCKMLGSVYGNLRKTDPIFMNGLICQSFYFGDRPNVDWLEEGAESELRELIYYQKHEYLQTIRVFRFYSDNVILIVKPDRLRYWIRSTAIRDADETLIDLREQGY